MLNGAAGSANSGNCGPAFGGTAMGSSLHSQALTASAVPPDAPGGRGRSHSH